MTGVDGGGPPEVIKLLAHDLRWRMVAALTRSDRRVQELVALVGEPANLVSYTVSRRTVVERRHGTTHLA